MDQEKPRNVYNLTKQPSPPCCLCDCVNDTHIVLFSCPLFSGENICVECCHEDTLKPGIEDMVSHKRGSPLTKEEMQKICRDCGRNSFAVPKGAPNEPII